jgi:hypothetical protein
MLLSAPDARHLKVVEVRTFRSYGCVNSLVRARLLRRQHLLEPLGAASEAGRWRDGYHEKRSQEDAMSYVSDTRRLNEGALRLP